jgi:hypothetical protein
MAEALKSLESSGGYAILLGIVIVAIVYLMRDWMKDQANRQALRESEAKADFEAQIEYERHNTEAYHATTERMISVVEGNTGAITTLVETIRPMSETLMRIDRHMGTDATARAPRKRTGESQQ